MQKVALVTEPVVGREDERVRISRVRKVGIDPHFAFANMLSDVALARAPHTAFMLFPDRPGLDGDVHKTVDPMMQQLHNAFPEMTDTPDPDLTCGTCMEFDPDEGKCRLRLFQVTPDQPMCHAYDPVPED